MSNDISLIQSKTVGVGGIASISFTDIPQSYTDLKILISARSDESGGTAQSTSLSMSINNVTTNRTFRTINAISGATAESTSGTSGVIGTIPGTAVTASTFNNVEVYIPNYTSSNNKSFSVDSVTENNSATNNNLRLTAGLWSQTNAITSIGFASGSGNFVQNSTFYLYGISNVTSTTKATGGIVSSDATYNYHMFPYSGTFTPTQNISVDYLVIAGGGSGAAGVISGGGGAGGLRSTVGATGGGGSLESALSLTANTAYTVTVGAGGAAIGGTSYVSGNPGNNSVFSTITATGGGRGSAYSQNNAGTGGSGGGANGDDTVSYTGGAASPSGQGFPGGNGQAGTPYRGGGGGGAGAAGANGSAGGNGGAGVSISAFANATQTGINTFYAGGGGRGWTSQSAANGTGGGGGGGTGGTTSSVGQNGIANTGGGGGGGGETGFFSSGAGGSGLVIIRYAK